MINQNQSFHSAMSPKYIFNINILFSILQAMPKS